MSKAVSRGISFARESFGTDLLWFSPGREQHRNGKPNIRGTRNTEPSIGHNALDNKDAKAKRMNTETAMGAPAASEHPSEQKRLQLPAIQFSLSMAPHHAQRAILEESATT